MVTSLEKKLSIAGLALAGASFAGSATAGCMADFQFLQEPTLQQQSWDGAGMPHLMHVDYRVDHADRDPIVGGWNIVLTAKGNTVPPDGVVIDAGIQQWHDDGTEFLNSSGQKPLTQNYCLGVWERTGPQTYRVNHFAYNYDTAQNVIGLTRIQEEIYLGPDGKRFIGTFRADSYDKLRNRLGGVKATVAGHRIELDTTAQDIQ